MKYQCGSCGDPHDGYHDCWLIQRMKEQEDLLPPEQLETLEVGHLPEDSRIPDRVRQVDLSAL